MKNYIFAGMLFSMVSISADGTDFGYEYDKFTSGDTAITIYFIGHGTLMIDFGGTVIHIDPVSMEGDYSRLPKADLVLITHEHPDHLDKTAVSKITSDNTIILGNPAAAAALNDVHEMANGDIYDAAGITVEAVPAYNTTPGRDKFHPQGRDNGYVLTLGSLRVYIAGDTEEIEEMKNLKDIDIAFLPMNQPYTMTPEQAADAAGFFKPRVVYPYHYGNTDPQKLADLLADSGIDVRIRPLK